MLETTVLTKIKPNKMTNIALHIFGGCVTTKSLLHYIITWTCNMLHKTRNNGCHLKFWGCLERISCRNVIKIVVMVWFPTQTTSLELCFQTRLLDSRNTDPPSVCIFDKVFASSWHLTRKNLHTNKMHVDWHAQLRFWHVVWLVKEKSHTSIGMSVIGTNFSYPTLLVVFHKEQMNRESRLLVAYELVEFEE